MSNTDPHASRFNEYRIIHVDEEHLIAEWTPLRSAVKKCINIKKTMLTSNFSIDQVVHLKVEYIDPNTVRPLKQAIGFDEIAVLQHEEDIRQDRIQIDIALDLLDQGVADSMQIEAGGFAAACKEEHTSLYQQIRLKRIKNLDALINTVAQNNGHPDYPDHEINLRFIDLCKNYLKSVHYELLQQEIHISQYLSAQSLARSYLIHYRIYDIRRGKQ